MESSSRKPLAQNGYDDQQEQHYSYAMQLVTSFALPMALHTAVELGVLEIIAKAGPNAQLSASQIVSQLPTRNPAAADMLDRILQLLASHSVLTCSVADVGSSNKRPVYGIAPVGRYFVLDEDGASLGPYLSLNLDKVFVDSWYQLKDVILEGGFPFHRAHKTHIFEYLSRDSRFNEVFNQAMINQSIGVIKRILEEYKGLDGMKTLVDVGGGLGITINNIISKYPTIRGVNFDLPHVIKYAPAYNGVEHVEGDMFESVPKGDAIFMKWILHDWNDDHCVRLLKNCYKALPVDGKIIVVDGILPAKPDSCPSVTSAIQTDVLMLAQCIGGRERSEQEFLALAKAGGFKGIKLECFVCNFWVMEFYK